MKLKGLLIFELDSCSVFRWCFLAESIVEAVSNLTHSISFLTLLGNNKHLRKFNTKTHHWPNVDYKLYQRTTDARSAQSVASKRHEHRGSWRRIVRLYFCEQRQRDCRESIVIPAKYSKRRDDAIDMRKPPQSMWDANLSQVSTVKHWVGLE